MSRIIDLTGQTFNYWTVISRAPNNKRGESMWNCKCACGNEKIVQGYSLRNNLSKSCGCLQKQKVSKIKYQDLVGQKFGHLTVIKNAGRDKSKKCLWECECDCQAKTHIITRTTDLKSGKTTSCGCIRSLGEEKIAFLLTEANIPFEKEKIFKDCIFPETNAYARFDFYVDNRYLIEYDGIQHFEPSFDHLKEGTFKICQTHDQFKNEWCQKNNIPLIRINYKQLNSLSIEDLLI